MGFTRFWKQPHGINENAWRAIVADTTKLLASVNVPLVGAVGEDDQTDEVPPGLPLVSDDEIAFNGVGTDAAEWFVLRPKHSSFECVKTYGRPYDLVVSAVLIIAKHHASAEILNVTSDDLVGVDNWDAWKLALELCARAGIEISEQTVALLKADVARESEVYEDPKSRDELELDDEWKRMYEGNLLRAFCEQRFPPKFLRYQATVRVASTGVKLQLRRSIDARSLPPTSPILREKVDELQAAWNGSHRIRILEVEIG